jgi:hypothetical protein
VSCIAAERPGATLLGRRSAQVDLAMTEIGDLLRAEFRAGRRWRA